MGFGWLRVDDGLPVGRGRADADGRWWSAGLARPTTHAAALAVAVHAFACALGASVVESASASAFWRVSWLSIAHLRRAGLMSMPRRSRRSSARKASTSVTGLPLISSVRRLALAWLIAQPRPV